jgi:hypothetical protein
VLFSIRPEIHKPNDDITQTLFIFRYDRAAFAKRRWLPGRRGIILRIETPIAQVSGRSHDTGLGDMYGQLLLVPHFTQRFAIVVGTGVVLPTATSDQLGTGKWILAPVAGPVWFLQRRGLVFLRFQNFASVAGADDRPDINYLVIAPTVLHTVRDKWWLLADTEVKTNWTRDRRTGIKSGVQIGRAIASRVGLWGKPEVWWGPNRDGQWSLKFGVVWYR